ncbi:MAG: TolC family protein [Phycisphaerales bacterium]
MNVTTTLNPFSSRARRTAAALLTALALTGGCTVGPDYQQPQMGAGSPWAGLDAGASAPGVTSHVAATPADVAAWWKQFGDDTLTDLVERSASGNLTLAQAETRVRQARALRDIAASGLYPTLDASAAVSRARTNAGTRNLYQAGFDAAWEIDVFGGTRRAVEAADADVQSAQLDSRSVLVSLVAEVASAYLDLRGQQHQLAIARENLIAQQQTLELTQQRFDAGFVSALDVANATAQTNQTASQIPLFDARIRADVFTIDVLLGQEPGTLLATLAPEPPATTTPPPTTVPPGDQPLTSQPPPVSPSPKPPRDIPIGLPSELLLRRSDVRKAEADLHAATARIGVAVANQYPRFAITGSIGLSGNQASSLVTLADRFWSIGPSVSLPILTGGRTQAEIDQAEAVAHQAFLAYRQSILVALQDVDTALVNFTREQQRRASLEASVAASRQAVDLSLQLYDNGRTDFLNVLTAQDQLRNIEAALALSETSVGTDLVALYKALGGGWNPQQQPESSSPR